MKTGTTSYANITGQDAMNFQIINNNATNYKNSFLKMNIKPKAGYTIAITEVTAIQSSSKTGNSYLFRIGTTQNGAVPNNSKLGQSTDNIKLTSNFTGESFSPGIDVATGEGNNYLTVWLCARGSNVSNFDWYVDKVVIKGEYITTGSESTAIIDVSNTVKQKLRFGTQARIIKIPPHCIRILNSFAVIFTLQLLYL